MSGDFTTVEVPRTMAARLVPEITFYRADKAHGYLSNLYRRPFLWMGREFPTAEHAYQFGKAAKPEVREWLMAAPSPSLLAMAAHGLYKWDIAPGWSASKVTRMRLVLTAKFTQHADLWAQLLGTFPADLVEEGKTNNAVNRFWGRVNGSGENMLGVLLGSVRESLRLDLIDPAMVRGLASGIEDDGSRCTWYAGPPS